jgi:predicted phage terminase large subunit-like protein
VWGDTRRELVARFPRPVSPISLTFIRMRLSDNPALTSKDPDYEPKLQALPLVERERLLGGNWNIRPTAGRVLNRGWFPVLAAAPTDVHTRVRYWDKAGTEDGGDYTAGVRLGQRADKSWVIEDVVRGQWSAFQRERVLLQCAASDPPGTLVWVEQEPGSGGKESAQLTVRSLAGYAVRADKVTGDALARVQPLAVQAEAGNVRLVAGAWTEAFLAECHAFPDGGHDDQVIAAAGAFNKCALATGVAMVRVTGI